MFEILKGDLYLRVTPAVKEASSILRDFPSASQSPELSRQCSQCVGSEDQPPGTPSLSAPEHLQDAFPLWQAVATRPNLVDALGWRDLLLVAQARRPNPCPFVCPHAQCCYCPAMPSDCATPEFLCSGRRRCCSDESTGQGALAEYCISSQTFRRSPAKFSAIP
jgi:hypothetical protein